MHNWDHDCSSSSDTFHVLIRVICCMVLAYSGPHLSPLLVNLHVVPLIQSHLRANSVKLINMIVPFCLHPRQDLLILIQVMWGLNTKSFRQLHVYMYMYQCTYKSVLVNTLSCTALTSFPDSPIYVVGRAGWHYFSLKTVTRGYIIKHLLLHPSCDIEWRNHIQLVSESRCACRLSREIASLLPKW